MIIRKAKTERLFHVNDGGERCLNIYYGCEVNCPFCYWQADERWLGQMTAFIDVAERLEEVIGDIPPHARIVLGYKGSSYSPLEKELELTRKCLKILLENEMKVMVSSSCDDIILRDLDLLKAFGSDAKVIMEMTRLEVVEAFNRNGSHKAFELAGRLKENGINICTTISPVMPGITDVERMAQALQGIPVHISKLDIRPGTIWNRNTLKYIEENHKELLPIYEEIARTGEDPYFESLKSKYEGTQQIQAYLPFWDEIPE